MIQFRPSQDQLDLMAALDGFLEGYGGSMVENTPVFCVSGAGGSGKTTILSRWASDSGMQTLYLAPTNAAAIRLRESLPPHAIVKTIHSAIYIPRDLRRDTEEEIKQLEGAIAELDKSDPEHAELKKRVRELTRFLRAGALAWEGQGSYYRDYLIIVDEASMVTEQMLSDLAIRCGSGTRIIAIGDDRQLPPVSGKPFFGTDHIPVGARLTTNHRTSVGQLSHFLAGLHADLRGDLPFGRRLARAADNQSLVETSSHGWEDLKRAIMDADIVLVFRNLDWMQVNAVKRHLLGLPVDRPADDEKLRAMRTVARGSGSDRRVLIAKNDIFTCFDGMVEDDYGTLHEVDLEYFRLLNEQAFSGTPQGATMLARQPQADKDASTRKSVQFAPAWASTVHSAQGNEWPTVMFIAPPWARYARQMEEKMPFARDIDKLQYTAASRARQRFIYVDSVRGTIWSKRWPGTVAEVASAAGRLELNFG